MCKKTNPRNIPRTQADCDRAFDRGVEVGVSNTTAIFLSVLVDKFGGAEYVEDVWSEIVKLSEEIEEKRVTAADLKNILKEEYAIYV